MDDRNAEERPQQPETEPTEKPGGDPEPKEEPSEQPEPEEAGAKPEEAPADPEGEAGPDWENPTSVLRWYGSEIIRLIGLARRKEALSRLRALAGALDCWAKLARLSADTSEIEAIKAELGALRRELEAQKGLGPRGVVRQ